MGSQIKSYKDLLVWQKSHRLAIRLYEFSSKRKKDVADWELWKQALKAVFSVSANIVEGYYSHRGKSFASHLEISRGSACEAQYWVVVLLEIKQVDALVGQAVINEYDDINAMLTGLIRKVRV